MAVIVDPSSSGVGYGRQNFHRNICHLLFTRYLMDVESQTCTCKVSGVSLLGVPERPQLPLPFHLFGARTIRTDVFVEPSRHVPVRPQTPSTLMFYHKQMVYWHQLDGNNVEVSGYDLAGDPKSPSYNRKMGFSNGEQNIKFMTSGSGVYNNILNRSPDRYLRRCRDSHE